MIPYQGNQKSKPVQLTFKSVEITAGTWEEVILQLRNVSDKDCEDLVLTLRVPWQLSTKKHSLRLAHLGPNSTGQIPVQLKASRRSASSLVKFDIDLHYFSAGVSISQSAQLELRIRRPILSPKPPRASGPAGVDSISLRALYGELVSHFDLEELRALCFDLEVDYYSLRGEDKAAKARALVSYMQRRSRLDELRMTVQRMQSASLEEIRASLERELAQHKRNIHKLLEQKSIYGLGEEPLHLLNQIEAEEVEIARIEAELKRLER